MKLGVNIDPLGQSERGPFLVENAEPRHSEQDDLSFELLWVEAGIKHRRRGQVTLPRRGEVKVGAAAPIGWRG